MRIQKGQAVLARDVMATTHRAHLTKKSRRWQKRGSKGEARQKRHVCFRKCVSPFLCKPFKRQKPKAKKMVCPKQKLQAGAAPDRGKMRRRSAGRQTALALHAKRCSGCQNSLWAETNLAQAKVYFSLACLIAFLILNLTRSCSCTTNQPNVSRESTKRQTFSPRGCAVP